jgi:hypothetical protein
MRTSGRMSPTLLLIFYHALNAKGRAGFVMANSAADARGHW